MDIQLTFVSKLACSAELAIVYVREKMTQN